MVLSFSSLGFGRKAGFAAWRTAASALALTLCLSPPPAAAQRALEDLSVRDLPRPGYQPRNLEFGAYTVAPRLDTKLIANSNIFAAPSGVEEDVIALIEPSIDIARSSRSTAINARAYGSLQRYFENDQENIDTFGAALSANHSLNRANAVGAGVSYGRGFERRDDPEANDVASAPRTDIDNIAANVSYAFRPGRFGAVLRGGFENSNFLADIDEDRDVTVMSASARALYAVSDKVDIFLQGSAGWRNFRTPVDRNGFDRDGETYTVNGGVALNLTGKLVGDIGAGFFRANLDDENLEDFSGFSTRGRLSWAPRARTRVSLSVYHGDIATIRSGASGRVDTTANLRLDQEIRRNLLGNIRLGYRKGRFRTAATQTEDDVYGTVGLEYLLNRNVSLGVDYELATREATNRIDEFTIHRAGLALKLRY